MKRLNLLVLAALASWPAFSQETTEATQTTEPADVYGIWQLEVEESVLRLRDKPQGRDFDPDEARGWVEDRMAARLIVDDRKIGITIGDSKRFYTYKSVEVNVYKVIFRVEAGGRQGRIELTRKGGELWVYSSTLTPYWNWSVWRKSSGPEVNEEVEP